MKWNRSIATLLLIVLLSVVGSMKNRLIGVDLYHILQLLGESIYDQKTPNPTKIDTKGFLTDSGRMCHVK